MVLVLMRVLHLPLLADHVLVTILLVPLLLRRSGRGRLLLLLPPNMLFLLKHPLLMLRLLDLLLSLRSQRCLLPFLALYLLPALLLHLL